ncbi:MAG: Carboxyl-terminal protease [Candidatus Nomurabacteria bacterium GW2011_GWA2_35_80]|uniref:Carboxyl-terminal protease n=1 Tax=Candidatus Nomurabacteria bacterium GW2011_GWA2_35_80 TaxID=1618733 RepID=A0A0G0G9S1_9BACT|nr:MAG: Carboxyl-terminal protease [Candidatus Nomurabacteria bacterium GW2011_GWA2_35_80]
MTFKNNFISEYFKTRRAFATILLVALFFGLGVYIGFNKRPEISKVIYGAISGLVDSLDDSYSVFFKPDEAKLFEDDIQGNFGGVGIEIGVKNKTLTVIAPLKNTPAYRVNIKSGDKILKINDLTTSGLSVEKAIKLIRGEVGTTVALTILHEGDKEPKEIKIVRDIINIPTLDTELRKDGIFVIKLYSFSANSANLFRKALKEFSLFQSDKLLLDLRGNPGGYLDAAVSMSSWFLEGGKTVVTEDYGNNTNPKIYRSQGYNIFSDKLKFAILIDNGSASASEIFAGAMQDYKKAFLIGEKSYGKGSVQEVVKVTPDTILKITVAKWLTPDGNSISEKGLIPDYEILITKKDLEEKIDPQLNKAVELLNNWPKK